MHGIAALTHLGDRFPQRALHCFQAGENRRYFIFAVHRHRPRQIALRNAVEMAADDRQRLHNHPARPEQRGAGQYRGQHNHGGEDHARHVIAGATVVPCRLHKLVNLLLPGLGAGIKRRLRFLHRRGEEVRQLVVFQPGGLMIQIAVPLVKGRLHRFFQLSVFRADRRLVVKGFEHALSLFQAAARGGH